MEIDTSIFFARLLGLAFVFYSLLILVLPDHFQKLLKEASENVAIIYLSAFIAFLMGASIVATHLIFPPDWRIVITILGLLLLLRGIIRSIFPEISTGIMKKMSHHKEFTVLSALPLLILGLYLLYHGYLLY